MSTRPSSRFDLVDERLHGRGVAHVEHAGDDAVARRAQLGRDLVEVVLVAVADREVGAEAPERQSRSRVRCRRRRPVTTATRPRARTSRDRGARRVGRHSRGEGTRRLTPTSGTATGAPVTGDAMSYSLAGEERARHGRLVGHRRRARRRIRTRRRDRRHLRRGAPSGSTRCSRASASTHPTRGAGRSTSPISTASRRSPARSKHDLGGVDVLVNNAGIPKRRRVPDLTPDVVESVMTHQLLLARSASRSRCCRASRSAAGGS